ncbi:MAG: nuclear transport factor 2 family protein [Acidobacteriota bacterium]|nr:nuclear transport factor 2 family protein [Acidobacteriota bacterium]
MSSSRSARAWGVAVAAWMLLVAACGSANPRGEARLETYRNALQQSAERASESLTLAQARERFVALYGQFTPEALRENVPSTFAPDAYLNDQIRELQGVEAIEEYLVETSEKFGEGDFAVEHAAREGTEFYFRWTMSFTLGESSNKPPLVAPGVSHVRFDDQGRILFQRDYWDTTSTVYERIPVLGGMIRLVKKRL